MGGISEVDMVGQEGGISLGDIGIGSEAAGELANANSMV